MSDKISLEDAKRAYEYIREAYRRADYKELNPFEAHSTESKEKLRDMIEKTMDEVGVDSIDKLLEDFYNNEEYTMKQLKEDYE